MKIFFSDQNLTYDGSQLRSHFAYRTFGILGDSVVAFIGPCQVDLDSMVDLEDVRRQAPIYSSKMLHFIVEVFDWELKTTILLQRLMVACVGERLASTGHEVERRGDDLYKKGGKLSVSIATRSPVSCLIHLGLNIKTDNVPVPAVGLEELGISTLDFTERLLNDFKVEFEGIQSAACKVRGVD